MIKETKRKWEVDFKMTEADSYPNEDEDPNTMQREITHAIGRTIGLIAKQYRSLNVTDHHIYCNGKEQPEVACLEPVMERARENK